MAVGESFDVSTVREYTVEAGRPDTVTREKLEALKNGGVTRISINPQTFNDDVLRVIGRKHTSALTAEKFYEARAVGFQNINMDFIAGLPTDSVFSFYSSIDKALDFAPENITVHTLSLKRSSNLGTSCPPDTHANQLRYCPKSTAIISNGVLIINCSGKGIFCSSCAHTSFLLQQGVFCGSIFCRFVKENEEQY